MELRDEIERELRSWNAYELERGANPVIDYDCFPGSGDFHAARDRVYVYGRLHELHRRASDAGADALVARLSADRAYLGALMGERLPLKDYIRATQGCSANGWPAGYIRERGEVARHGMASLGISWGPDLMSDLEQIDPIDIADAPDAIREAATEYESAVRKMTGSDAPYELSIETVNIDDYWAYWLDGSGQQVRLRLNLRNARFTKAESRQFALHEILGHGLQNASFAARCAREPVPWVRVMSVHAIYQIVLEGLAEAMPFFVAPEDELLIGRVRVSHYSHMVRARLHLAINSGTSVDDCVSDARSFCPWWTDEQIGDILADRGVNPRLRSYLWAYPAGLDWFAALAEAEASICERVLRAAYRDPQSPADLAALWPEGPVIGGPE